MTVEEMKLKWPDEDWIPPKTRSEKEVPKKDMPEEKALEKDAKGRTAEEKMANEQKHFNPLFRITVLERRLIARRISLLEFQKQHHLGKQAILRPDTKDIFELGQYVIVSHMKGYPQLDGASALVIGYKKTATGPGSYTIAMLGRHAGNDFAGCPSDILKACTDEKVWNKMFNEDQELARDCVFIEFGSELKDHLR
jgi:hypothetical protein